MTKGSIRSASMHGMTPDFGDALQLRVALRYITPTIWRTLTIPAHLPLVVLHDALQWSFGWENSHLHDFQVGEVRFALPQFNDGLFCVDESVAPLGAFARVGSKFLYRYDFGDDWEHDVVVEAVVNGRDGIIKCTGGARACPPEDCGGPPGYDHLLQVLATPNHEEHDSMKRWVGKKFDAERFDLAAVNKKLATLSKKVARALR